MSSFQDRVIEAAVRPFSDNAELKLAAAELLGRASGNPSEEAIARWDALDASKRGPVRRWLPWGLLAAASALMWLAESREMIAYFQWVKCRSAPFFEPPPYQAEQRTAARLNARGKLLVFGDPASQDIVVRKEKLWQSDPGNPAYYTEYAAVFAARNHKMPPNFLETARRLDPDNAWFTYLAAGADMNEYGWLKRSNGKLLREARTQTKCTSYTAELLLQRLSLLPQGNLMERFDSVGCLDNSSVSAKLELINVCEVIATAADLAAQKGDVAEFQEIARDADYFLRWIYQDEVSSLRGEAVNASIVERLAKTFTREAQTLGLRQEAEAWEKIVLDMRKRDEIRSTREFALDGKEVESGKVTGSLFGYSVERLADALETPLPLTDADVKPGRLLDHEILSRFFNYLCWLVMTLCLGLVAAYRFRVSALSRRLAARMAELLRPADWAWIVGLGILLPFAYVMGINRLTPLGGREFGMRGTALPMPACHFLGLLVLWLVVPVQIIRWRLARRAGGFGFSGPSRIGWLAVACAVAFVPWIGSVAISAAHLPVWELLGLTLSERIGLSPITMLSQVYRPLLFVLGVSALWLAGVAARALFCRADRHFHRAAAARVLVVSWAAALAVLCLASQGFKAAERYWFARDELGRMDPARPGWSVYEYRVATQLRKEMRDILGYGQ